MANLKISELDAGTTPLVGDELVAVVQAGATVRVPSSALKGLQGDPGDDGREVELQKGTTHIQWRYVGGPTWTDLVALDDITGPPGTGGAPQWDDIEGKPDLVLEGDSRLSDARTPTGGAGGVLSGTFPNPGFAVDMATQGELDTQIGLVYAAIDDLDTAKVDKVTGKGLSTEDYTTAEKTKLSGIATAATANSSDATLLARANHTGTQAISTVTGLQAELDLKAPLASPTFTGTVSGVTKTHVGLSNVDNTADTAKPVSTAQQTALDLKAPLASPTFTGTVSGITKAHVGLSNVDNTADTAKPVSTAQQTALDAKQATLVSATNIKTINSGSLLGAGNIAIAGGDATANIGYLNIPQNSQSTAYTAALTDAGKHLLHPSADTTARTFTIPANSSVAFAVGTALTFINQNAAGVMTIAITTDTMRLAGAGTTGSRSLAANGVATAIKLTSTEWIISGVGLT